MECTARSISPASSASSISLVNRPLPPTSASGRSWMRSPEVRMTHTSTSCRPAPCAASRRSRTSCACASASGDPRVPIRIFTRACTLQSLFRCYAVPDITGPFMLPTRPRCKRSPMAMATTADTRETLVLGIETSCDETAAAVVARERRRPRPHPRQRGAGAVGGAPPLRRRGAGARRARPRRVPRRDHLPRLCAKPASASPASTRWR